MKTSYFLPGALLALAGVSAPLRAGPLTGDGPGQACVVFTVDGIDGTPICTGVLENGDFRGGIQGPITVTGATGGNILATIDSLTFGGNVDPSLGFALGITDVGPASTFSFTFITPVVSALYSAAFQTHSTTLTDGANNGSSIAPVAPNLTIQRASAGVGVATTNLGVDVGALCSDGPGAPVSANCGPNELASSFAPTLYDVLQINVDFTGSGGGDFFGITGRADLTTAPDTGVPEPASSLLCGIGLVATAFAMRKFA